MLGAATVFPCYATADRDLAREICGFLEAGAGARIFFEDGAIRPGERLVDKAREGFAADVLLLGTPDGVQTITA